MKDIHINWEGPLSLEDAFKLNSSIDFGIYQYYGSHPIYGDQVLLYIGKAVKQTFATRLSQHNWQEWIPSETRIQVGRIFSTENVSNLEWEDQIDLAEKILIFSHSPAFNTANLNRINYTKEDVRVLNWGKRRSLLPEISISRWEGGETLGHKIPKKFNAIVGS